MRWARILLLLAGCDRPAAAPPAARGVELEQVQLTTWRGAELSVRGTARQATLTSEGFTAVDVTLTTAGHTTLRAPALAGQLDLEGAQAPNGVAVSTAEGCAGSTPDRVDYEGGVATTTGPVTGGGCGFTLQGSRLVYSLAERRAEVFGPVRTRVEAQP